MKRLLLLPALLFAVVAVAQDAPKPITVPADKMEAAAKPFLGTWNGISCQEKPAGIRFKIAQVTPTDAPTATLLQTFYEGKLDLVGNEWETAGFQTRFNKQGEPLNFLFITNNTLLLGMTEYKGKLFGMASIPPADGSLVILVPAGDTKLEDFVAANANICTDPAAQRKFLGLPEPKK